MQRNSLLRLVPVVGALAVLAQAAPVHGQSGGAAMDAPRAERLESLLRTLAHDSMEGRRSGTPGSARAARFLAAELDRYGVQPAGDDGWFQRVPMVRVPRGDGSRLVLGSSVDADTIPGSEAVEERNVVGIIPGTDPTLRDEVVVIGAHFDHVGVGRPVDGDSIYNGADDDGSGTVAVLEIARALAAGEGPGRTVVVLLSTAEESGLLGTRWYLEHPVRPLEATVADLQIEMIGRPDSLAGGPGRGWLTGYELSTMGDILAAQGSPIVPDPRPDQNFFRRSDNYAFAVRGIPAHTLSSYGLHEDYHRPSDEVEAVDFGHMAAVVDAAEAMVRALASGPRPEWHPGMRPGGG